MGHGLEQCSCHGALSGRLAMTAEGTFQSMLDKSGGVIRTDVGEKRLKAAACSGVV